MSSSLTDKTLSGFVWAFGERFGVQAMQLVIFIVLARILTPEDFGLMGMLAVFIAVSRSLADSGFGQALIQKKGADEVDFSSVFYMNLLVSVVIYGLLFMTAPFIAAFYGEPVLIELIRVLSFRLIAGAFSMVQVAKLTKEVKFKKLMIAKLPSTLLGGLAGIVAGYMDYGVWSLVIQQLTDATAYSIQIWIQSKWRPGWVYDKNRVKELFDFGGKLMAAGVLNAVYKNIYEIVIGRFFSTEQVGLYTQASKIKQLPVQNISSALGRVTFPVLSEIQDDNPRLKRVYKKIIRQVFLLISPLMIGGIILAEPLFRLVLTEKWINAVPYFQWLCITGLFYPANSYNLNILKVKGRSDLVLVLSIVKKVCITFGLFIFINVSVLAVVIFKAVFSVLAFFINTYYSGHLISYGIFEQLIDIWKFLFFSVVMAGFIWFIIREVGRDFQQLVLGLTFGIIIYGILIYFFERKILIQTIQLIKNKINQLYVG